MIIMGIDPGTAKLGYALVSVSDSKSEKKGYKKLPKLLESNVITTPAGMVMQKRLKIIYNNITSISKEFKPDIMVIEKLFFNTNVRTAMSVGQARGVVMLVAGYKRMDVYEYTALEAKKVLTDYGRASKKEMQEAVKEALGLTDKVKSIDANDAVAMCLCFLHKDYETHMAGSPN